MTKEKLDIGRRVYAHELTAKEAAEQNDVTVQTIYLYVREYQKSIGVDPLPKGVKRVEPSKDYGSMTKEELINELMLKDIEVARAKKGYAVKGGGKEKEFVSIRDASSK
jgi:transposase-like protein